MWLNLLTPGYFFKKENITPCAMKTHVQKSYKVKINAMRSALRSLFLEVFA